MKETPIEKCLDNIPNKFDLSVLVMNRAKEILLSEINENESSNHSDKSINRAIKEIQDNNLDIDNLKEKIKVNLTSNNLFLKEELNNNFNIYSDKNDSDIENINDADNIIEDIDDTDDDLYSEDADDIENINLDDIEIDDKDN